MSFAIWIGTVQVEVNVGKRLEQGQGWGFELRGFARWNFPPVFVGSDSVKVCQDPLLAVSLVKEKGGEACTGFQRFSIDPAWDCPGSFGMLIVIF